MTGKGRVASRLEGHRLSNSPDRSVDPTLPSAAFAPRPSRTQGTAIRGGDLGFAGLIYRNDRSHKGTVHPDGNDDRE